MIGGGTELYVATWHHDRPDSTKADKHVDHVACVLAARDLADMGVPVRFAKHPGERGYGYTPGPHQSLRIESAIASYKMIGQRSVRATFREVKEINGRAVVSS